MNSEENNFETVVIEGRAWAVTPGNENSEVGLDTDSASAPEAVIGTAAAAEDSPEATELSGAETTAAEPPDESSDTQESGSIDIDDNVEEAKEPEFDSLRSLTSLLLGGAIEGTSQLVSRLKNYEEELQKQAAENEADPEDTELRENELDRLRFALVGLVLDAQSTFKRNISLWARVVNRSARVTNRAASPVTNSFLFGRMQRRYDRFVSRGEESLSRWIVDGRIAEPHSRELAKMTYQQIVDEFIDHLAENPELQQLITQQSIGLASEARDEVRERTVTADNLMEGIVRRILRRTPRAELPSPPPEVQRWASMTLDEYKVESKPDDTES